MSVEAASVEAASVEARSTAGPAPVVAVGARPAASVTPDASLLPVESTPPAHRRVIAFLDVTDDRYLGRLADGSLVRVTDGTDTNGESVWCVFLESGGPVAGDRGGFCGPQAVRTPGLAKFLAPGVVVAYGGERLAAATFAQDGPVRHLGAAGGYVVIPGVEAAPFQLRLVDGAGTPFASVTVAE